MFFFSLGPAGSLSSCLDYTAEGPVCKVSTNLCRRNHLETNGQLPAGYLLGKPPFQSLFPEEKFLWRKPPPVPCGRTARKKARGRGQPLAVSQKKFGGISRLGKPATSPRPGQSVPSLESGFPAGGRWPFFHIPKRFETEARLKAPFLLERTAQRQRNPW